MEAYSAGRFHSTETAPENALQGIARPLVPRAVAAKGKSGIKISRQNAAQTVLLDELKAAAEKLGLRVREERLLREVGYRVRSGIARLKSDEVLFLDRSLSPVAQIDILIDELATRATDDVYLSPAARALMERATARETRQDAARKVAG